MHRHDTMPILYCEERLHGNDKRQSAADLSGGGTVLWTDGRLLPQPAQRAPGARVRQAIAASGVLHSACVGSLDGKLEGGGTMSTGCQLAYFAAPGSISGCVAMANGVHFTRLIGRSSLTANRTDPG